MTIRIDQFHSRASNGDANEALANFFATRSFLKAPNPDLAHVVEFCASVAPDAKPLIVPVKALADMKPVECFFNVLRAVELHGGELLYGWAIWERPGLFIEAEHHAVWSSPDGLVDVTPDQTQIVSSRTFLPDAERVFDFEGCQRIDNQRRALKDTADVVEFLQLAAKRFEILENCSNGREIRVAGTALKQLQEIQIRMQRINLAWLSHQYAALNRNDRCLCNSGRKYKQCCMNEMRDAGYFS